MKANFCALWRGLVALGLVVPLTLSGCVPLQSLEPAETVWVWQHDDWERLTHRRLLRVDAITESSFLLEHASPQLCLVNVSEIGVTAQQFFDEGQGGVGKWLWRRGFSVLSVSIPSIALENQNWREQALAHFVRVFDAYAQRCKDKAMVGIGHGVGGSLLLEPSLNTRLAGVVLVSVPLTYAGTSVATQTLLSSERDWAWRDLVAYPVPANFAGTQTMEEVVVTNQSSSEVRFEFYRSESMRLPSTFRKALLSEVSDVTDLTLRSEIKSWLFGTQPAFIVLPSGNGWVSTWQSDPIALGAPPSRASRLYITRANGSSREFNHFDVFWDDDAISEVWRPVAHWLRETSF